jgi:5-methylcytosine-specific restriction endonuclease McrA
VSFLFTEEQEFFLSTGKCPVCQNIGLRYDSCYGYCSFCGEKLTQHSIRLPATFSPEPKLTPYRDYLQSERWRLTRIEALDRAANKCQLCTSKNSLNVHHNTYERLGRELPSDLVVLCYSCHQKFHDELPLSSEAGYAREPLRKNPSKE